MGLKMVTVTELKSRLAGVVAELTREAGPVYVTQHGKPRAVLVSYEEFEALKDKLDDLEDALAMTQSLASPEAEAVDLEEYERRRLERLRG